jgi:hypothetical protein
VGKSLIKQFSFSHTANKCLRYGKTAPSEAPFLLGYGEGSGSVAKFVSLSDNVPILVIEKSDY